MANPEHVKILKQGVEVWNRRRDENPGVRSDLSGTSRRGIFVRFFLKTYGLMVKNQ
jgi:hypothetical protein